MALLALRVATLRWVSDLDLAGKVNLGSNARRFPRFVTGIFAEQGAPFALAAPF
jgi:hypothetical protein